MRINRSSVFCATLAMGFLTVTAGAARVSAQQSKDVNVTNTAANPVPVAVQGTPSVTVSNQLTVRNADAPTNQPVSVSFTTNTTSGSGFQFWSTGNVYTVPAGKRLVIEDLDMEFFITPSGNTGSARANLFIAKDTTFFPHTFGVSTQPVQCTLSQTCFSLSRSARIYVDAGFNVSIEASANITQSGGFHFARGTISGYLVDVP